mgnify:CR=1 FL=1
MEDLIEQLLDDHMDGDDEGDGDGEDQDTESGSI